MTIEQTGCEGYVPLAGTLLVCELPPYHEGRSHQCVVHTANGALVVVHWDMIVPTVGDL